MLEICGIRREHENGFRNHRLIRFSLALCFGNGRQYIEEELKVLIAWSGICAADCWAGAADAHYRKNQDRYNCAHVASDCVLSFVDRFFADTTQVEVFRSLPISVGHCANHVVHADAHSQVGELLRISRIV